MESMEVKPKPRLCLNTNDYPITNTMEVGDIVNLNVTVRVVGVNIYDNDKEVAVEVHTIQPSMAGRERELAQMFIKPDRIAKVSNPMVMGDK